jgi:hypothetical protein
VAKHKQKQSSRLWLVAAGILIPVLVLLGIVLILKLIPDPVKPSQSRPPGPATSADLYCLEFSRYSGEFFEDGTHEPVTNVAAALIENRSPEFLDLATITYEVGGRTAEFVVTGLPPGGKAWVLEKNRLTIKDNAKFRFLDCTSTFRQDAVLTTNDLAISPSGNTLTVCNTSEYTLENVCIYYKTMDDDGVYLGGISYMLAFDTLAPGESALRPSSHFTKDSHIVRYSYQTQ